MALALQTPISMEVYTNRSRPDRSRLSTINNNTSLALLRYHRSPEVIHQTLISFQEVTHRGQ